MQYLLIATALAFAQGDGFQREGDGERREALDKMEGQAAPAWEAESWVQGETTLKDLKGKVILLDFWGVW